MWTLTMSRLVISISKSVPSIYIRGGYMLSFNQSTPLLRQLDEIRDSLTLINQEITIISHVTEAGTKETSGFYFRLSQMLIFNIGSLSKIIDSLNEPKKEGKPIRDDFGIFNYMTIAERTEYDQISGLQHQVIAQWRIVENRKWELLKTIRNRLKSQNKVDAEA
jgi:hypothetical protein